MPYWKFKLISGSTFFGVTPFLGGVTVKMFAIVLYVGRFKTENETPLLNRKATSSYDDTMKSLSFFQSE